MKDPPVLALSAMSGSSGSDCVKTETTIGEVTMPKRKPPTGPAGKLYSQSSPSVIQIDSSRVSGPTTVRNPVTPRMVNMVSAGQRFQINR